MKNIVIFCDFDGTITNSDNIIAIMKQFAPDGWELLKDDILAERMSIREGVGKLFSLLPSALKSEITDYLLKNAVIRAGFDEFVAFTVERKLSLNIVSGGIDFFVEPILAERVPANSIFCNGADFQGTRIKLLWPYRCDEHCTNDCGCCKPTLIRRLSSSDDYLIVIGDSITDVQAAKLAHKVIARDFLLEKCAELKLNYAPFETFYDVIDIVKAELEVIT